MKLIGVIPARYQSSRLPGKPLADICGRPMIWWVYQQVIKVKEIENALEIINGVTQYQILLLESIVVMWIMSNTYLPKEI